MNIKTYIFEEEISVGLNICVTAATATYNFKDHNTEAVGIYFLR